MPTVVNMLTAVQTAEVSLVKRGANNKRFALTKSKEQQMPIQELAKTVIETEAEGEGKLIETLKAAGADEETIGISVANFRLQSGFKDKLSKEAFRAVAEASGFEVAKAKKTEDEEDEEEGNPFASKKKTTKEEGEPMTEEMRKAFDEQQAELVELRKAAAEKDARIERIEKAAQLKEYVAKCASDYAHVPGSSAEEMGEMLQKAYSVDEDLGKRLEKQWAEASEAIKKSELIRSRGINAVSDGSGTAWGKMEAFAKELTVKNEGLSEGKAMRLVMEQHPELYQEYLNENPAQLGRR